MLSNIFFHLVLVVFSLAQQYFEGCIGLLQVPLLTFQGGLGPFQGRDVFMAHDNAHRAGCGCPGDAHVKPALLVRAAAIVFHGKFFAFAGDYFMDPFGHQGRFVSGLFADFEVVDAQRVRPYADLVAFGKAFPGPVAL
jgi:hypothetical protein